MKVRIGIPEGKVVEVDVSDEKSLKSELENAVKEDGMAWFTDTRGRTVDIPASKVAYVEIENDESGPAVGFAPAV